MTWLQKISANILDKKKLRLEDYLNGLISDSAPFDEIGILIFSRMFHIHMCVLMKGYFWTTNDNEDMEQCDITLVYRGALVFDDTTRKVDNEEDLEALHQTQSQDKIVQIRKMMNKWCTSLNQGICLILKRWV